MSFGRRILRLLSNKLERMNKLLLCSLLLALATLKSLSAQNSCTEALPIEVGFITVNTIFGTGELPQRCNENRPRSLGNWYTFSFPTDTLVDVFTLGGSGATDTYLHIYAGNCDSLVCIGGDDDSNGNLMSLISFQALAGVTYYVLLDNTWGSGGAFQLHLQITVPPTPPLVEFEMIELDGVIQANAIVDMNGDYLDDIVDATRNVLTIRYQQEDGSFVLEEIALAGVGTGPDWSVAAGDVDGNGFNDIIYGGSASVTMLLANDDGTAYTPLNYAEFVFSQRTNFVDINMDGLLDAFVCHDIEPNVFYLNNGDGTLAFNQGSIGDTPDGGNYGSIWIDYDNDGDSDLFISKCRGGTGDANINQLLSNNGDGTFTEVQNEVGLADSVQTWSSAWGDFDNDGDQDVFVGASSFSKGGHKLMRNDNGIFVDITAASGLNEMTATSIETVTHDFDNDGLLDIFGAGNNIWVNNGDMTFTPSSIPFGHGPIGDINNDGFMDVIGGDNFLNSSSGVTLGVPNGNNYLIVNLAGTLSNKNGIGARVEVYSALGKQIRDVVSGDGFAFMSTLNPHFGIGTDAGIDSVLVRWPSGMIDVIVNPQINTSLRIIEGEQPSRVSDRQVLPLSIFPNPTNDRLTFTLENSQAEAVVNVFDLNGRLLRRNTTTERNVDVSNYPAGTYLLVVATEGRILRTMFVKQ